MRAKKMVFLLGLLVLTGSAYAMTFPGLPVSLTLPAPDLFPLHSPKIKNLAPAPVKRKPSPADELMLRLKIERTLATSS